ncbi:hypothetical protein M422DRAFT_269669 [Sphaerobolus stellatus SS14]|uniref:Uncharacterized protein n=1 Tax=Sphaerobolus stellatus (strain SS14) TaxID=990650 RepID=A0A0C9UUZ2_SPHS4|nr:hypothetical protein M422DRAFT_269669 [Sphaerobolus stellatus SS14]
MTESTTIKELFKTPNIKGISQIVDSFARRTSEPAARTVIDDRDEILDDRSVDEIQRPKPEKPYGGDPGDGPPNGDGFPGGNGGFSSRKDWQIPPSANLAKIDSKESHFDVKMKPENIPSWDGDPDKLARWILKMNKLAERSQQVFIQLGELVPTRLEKDAYLWFWALPWEYRDEIMKERADL